MAAPIRFLSGRQQQQKIGIEGSTEDKKVLEVVGRAGIGTTSFEPSKVLDVRGDAIVEGTATLGNLEITGTGGVPASITVETANVTGVSTFGGAVDVNAGLDVDGQADLDEVVVAGVATFSNAVDINSTLDVDGDTQLDDLNVAGVATFSSAINATDIIKGYEYTAAPFGSTVTLAVTVASKDSTHRYNGTGSSNAYVIDGIQSPFLTLTPGRTYRFTNDNTGSHPFRFYLEADKTTQYDTNVNFQDTYTEITITDETPTVLHYQCSSHPFMGNAIQTNANVVNTNYPATIRSTLNVTGVSTFPQLDVSTGGLDVDGLTNLDEVVVAGVSTFTGNIVAVSAEFSGNVTIAGTLTAEDKTNIDSLGIVTARTGVRVDAGGLIVTAGVSTFTDSVDIDNGVGVVGGLTADSLTISGVTTGINAAGISSFVRIDVDGQADLDEVVIAGVATFQGAVNFDVNSEINIGTGVTILGNNLHVTGIVSAAQFIGDGSGITNLPGISTLGSSNLTDVNVSGTTTTAQLRVSGIGTAEKFFVSTGGFEVDGQSDLDELVVAGVSTFNANTNVVGDLSVTGDIGASGIITATGINLVAGSGLDVGAVGVLTALSIDVSTGGIDVDGQATLDEVVVAGVATFSALADVNNRLDVVGGANIDQLNVTGIASFAQLDISTGGIDVDGQATLDEVVVAGASTFTGAVKIDGALDIGVAGVDVEGLTNLDELIVAGVSTFTGAVDINAGLDVDGQTDLDELQVAGVSTFSAKAVFNTAYPSIDADNEIQVGTAIQLGKAGVITATSFVGSGANLTGVGTQGTNIQARSIVIAGVSTFNNDVNFIGDSANIVFDKSADALEFKDTAKAIFGTGDDLTIYHNSHSYIDHSGTNNLHIRNTTNDQDITIQTDDGSGNLATYFQAEGASGKASLHFYGAKKLATNTGGIDVTGGVNATGVVTATSFSGDGSALTGIAATDHVSTFDLVVAGVSTFNEDIKLRDGKDIFFFDSSEQSTGRIFAGSPAGVYMSATRGILNFSNQSTTGTNAGQIKLNCHSSNSIEQQVGGTTKLQVNGSGIDVTGIVTATGDFSIADKIVHTGDTNTALRFPAADTFTVETSGNERIRVSAAGTISIGSAGRTDWDNSTNVGCQFQIEGLTQPTSRMSITRNSNDAFDGGIILGKSRGTSDGSATILQDGDGLGFISFQGADGTTMLEGAKIDAIVQSSVASDDMPTDLVFYTNNDTTTTTERLRITSTGKLEVYKGSSTTGKTSGSEAFTVGNGASNHRFAVYPDGTTVIGGTGDIANNNIILQNDGKIGIGVTNPSENLHTIGDVMIQGTGGTGEQSLFIGKSATVIPSTRGVAVAADQNSSADHDMVLKTSTGSSGLVERVRITSGGNVNFLGNLVNVNATGVSTFSGIATHIDTLHGQTLKIAGVSTFSDAVNITKVSNALNVNVLTNNDAINIQNTGSTVGVLAPESGNRFKVAGRNKHLLLSANDNGGDTYEIHMNSSSRRILTATPNGAVAVSGILTATALNIVAGSGLDAGNTGIITAVGAEFNGTSHVKVPAGSTAQRPGSPTAGDLRYNSDDGAFEGYTDSWGAIGGGIAEVDTNVSSTSAVGVGSFATASFRSAEVVAQIVQIDEYQVGKYLMIHDGTTVTVIEQTAVATGDAMLGSFDGVINGSNAELRVNMVSSGIATVTTKISTVTV